MSTEKGKQHLFSHFDLKFNTTTNTTNIDRLEIHQTKQYTINANAKNMLKWFERLGVVNLEIYYISKVMGKKQLQYLWDVLACLEVFHFKIYSNTLPTDFLQGFIRMIISEPKRIIRLELTQNHSHLDACSVFEPLSEQKDVHYIKFRDLKVFSPAKSLTKHIKNAGENLRDLEGSLCKLFFPVVKFTLLSSNLHNLTSLRLNYENENEKIFVPLMFPLSNGKIFEHLSRFQLDSVCRCYLSSEQIYVLLKLLIAIKKKMSLSILFDILLTQTSSLIIASILSVKDNISSGSTCVFFAKEDALAQKKLHICSLVEKNCFTVEGHYLMKL
eukprot:snap_masked-scaffold_87-processed-gene-0.15-mRNA-1 protein AED:1.00 eAED:1.00 QI:0/-1/0/0/-1/1/1/0/328